MQMNTEEWQRVFLLCGISVVRVLSSLFFSVFLFAVQMTAIKAGQTRAKHRAPLNVISSRRERNKGRSDSSGRERERQTTHSEAVHLQTMFSANTVSVHRSAYFCICANTVRMNIKKVWQQDILKTKIHSPLEHDYIA